MFDLPLWPVGSEGTARTRRSDLLLFSAVTLLLMLGIYSAVGMLDREPAPGPAIAAPAVSKTSIAVLAFDSFDGQSQTDYFGSSLAEEILNLLAGIPEMDVAARTSSFQFRGRQVDVREVAKTLGVSHVLEGSVRVEGGRLRVTAQLIDGRNGYHQLSKTFDREMADVFAIQLEIANAVVADLKLSLSPDSRRQLDTPKVENLEAYLLYLQAREKLLSSPEESVAIEAGKLFAQALKLDPEFSRAHAGICEVKLHLYELSNDTREFSKAEAACTEAARLDPGKDSDISLAMARLYRVRGWHERAIEQVQNFIASAPDSPDAHIELGEISMAQSRNAEAEASFRRAVELKDNYWKAHEALGNFYARSERYQDSVKAYAEVIRLAPDLAAAHAGQGAAYWMLGEADNASAAWDRSLALKPSRQAYTNIGLRYYYAGRFDQAAAMQQSALEFAPNDHRVWGRLAESYRFVPGKERESGNAYRRAADLAEENLDVDGSDWATRGLLGLYYLHSDRAAEGQAMVDRAVTDSKRNPEALYYQGLARLEAGDSEGAIDVLAEALEADAQYRQFLQTDPDLARLRETERFGQVLENTGQHTISGP